MSRVCMKCLRAMQDREAPVTEWRLAAMRKIGRPIRARDLLEAEHARGARKAELVTMGMWLVYQSRAGSVRRIARGLYEVAS